MRKKISAIIICILFFGTVTTALGVINCYYPKKIDSSGTIEIIDQQQITDCGYGCPFFSNLWLAQGFTPILVTITRAELKLFKSGNIDSDITLSIRSSLTGSDLTSVTIDGNEVSGNIKWIEFDFTDIIIIPNQMYYIVCRTSGGSVVNYYCCLFQINNPYQGGEVWGSLNSGGTWEIIEYPGYPDPDGCFKIYGLDDTPNIPKIEGPAQGTEGIEYTYRFSTVDPDNHDLFYYIIWDDNTNSGWLGPYSSGEEIFLTHSWSEKGKYIILAIAKDVYGAESEWGEFEVEIPRNRVTYKSFLVRIFEQLPTHILSLLRFFLE